MSVTEWGAQEEEKQVWKENDRLCFRYVEDEMPAAHLGGNPMATRNISLKVVSGLWQ